jgi:hypothetical protein
MPDEILYHIVQYHNEVNKWQALCRKELLKGVDYDSDVCAEQ